MILDTASTLLSEANQFVTGQKLEPTDEKSVTNLVGQTRNLLEEALREMGNVLRTSTNLERDGREIVFVINILEEKILELLRNCLVVGCVDAAEDVSELALWLVRVNVAIQNNWPWRSERDMALSFAECVSGKCVDVRDIIATLQS